MTEAQVLAAAKIIAESNEYCAGATVPCAEGCDCVVAARAAIMASLGGGDDYVAVLRADVEEAVAGLGGFMGSVSRYRAVEALRDRLRALLK